MIINHTFLTLFLVALLTGGSLSEEYDDYSDSESSESEDDSSFGYDSYEDSPIDGHGKSINDLEDKMIEEGCGISKREIHLRIIGGQNGRRGMWPWQVSLTKGGSHACGGALIKKQWILTAAHCFLADTSKSIREEWVARLGVHKLEEKEILAENVSLYEVYAYPGYVPDGFLHDIALIKLSRPIRNIKTNRFINTVCLPQHSKMTFEGYHCVATGWGLTSFTGNAEPVYPNELQRVALSVVPQTQCHSLFHSLGFNRHQLCAGGYGKTACYGDSGGPFVCQEHKGHWILTGINSYGRGGNLVKCNTINQHCALGQCYKFCQDGVYNCHEVLPTVFTRTASYLDWIRRVIREN